MLFSSLFRFPNPPQAIVGPLATICDPYLNLFRGIIPPLGGTIDLSPILAFVVLDVSVLGDNAVFYAIVPALMKHFRWFPCFWTG